MRIVLPIIIGMLSLPAIGAESVRLVAIYPLTGIATASNPPYAQMAELAIHLINSQGGLLGRPAKLVVIDNKSTPIGSIQAARKAVGLDATVVIGAIWSSNSLAMAPVLQNAKIPMISPFSTHPEVTRIGNYIFRVCLTDAFQGKALARFAHEELYAGNSVVLKIIDEEYSLRLAEYFIEAFTKLGGKILLEESYMKKAINFNDILNKVRKHQPDITFIPGYERDSGLLIKQAVSMGIKTTFLGGDGWSATKLYDYGGEALEGSFYFTHCHPEMPSSMVLLRKAYMQRYGKEMESLCGLSLMHDAFMLAADAIGRAGTSNRKKIRDALAETRDFHGATGTITFDENGNPLGKEAVIIKIQKGIPLYLETIKK